MNDPAYLNAAGSWKATKSERNLPPHTDPALEIILVLRGEVHWVFDDHTRRARGGDITWTWPWERHAGGQGITTSEIYWIQVRLERNVRQRPTRCPLLHPSLGFTPEESRPLQDALLSVPAGKIHSQTALRNLIPSLIQRLRCREGLEDVWIRNQTRQILIELAERCLENRSVLSEPPALERVRSFSETLRESIDEPWTLESMAETCGLGRTQFARHYAEVCGETPLRHLNRLRIDAAREKLLQNHSTVTDIAFECGFGSSQHFARVFRQFTGDSPSTFRNRRS